MSNLSRSEINKRYYQKNRDKKLAQAKLAREKNKDAHNLRAREWYQNNKGENLRKKRSEYERKRHSTNVNARLAKNLRVRLRQALKRNKKLGSAVKLLGITVEELKKHLENKFQPGMSWDNYGEWHIDHIIPISKFNLANPEELSKACHYSNLQPLWKIDNLRKKDKLEVKHGRD